MRAVSDVSVVGPQISDPVASERQRFSLILVLFPFPFFRVRYVPPFSSSYWRLCLVLVLSFSSLPFPLFLRFQLRRLLLLPSRPVVTALGYSARGEPAVDKRNVGRFWGIGRLPRNLIWRLRYAWVPLSPIASARFFFSCPTCPPSFFCRLRVSARFLFRLFTAPSFRRLSSFPVVAEPGDSPCGETESDTQNVGPVGCRFPGC